MKRVTLYDVAREAGVSHMTVSRVVRGANLVKRATREKVEAAVNKLEYQPDPALSALAAYRTLGSKAGSGHGSQLVFLDCDGTPYSQVVLGGVKQEAALLGYSVGSFRVKSDPGSQAQLSRMLYHRGVRGLLFGPSDEPLFFEGWEWPKFAFVSLGALTHQPPMHAVALDYFHGALTACGLLGKLGCRRLALVIDPRLEARTAHRWRGGYVAGLKPKEAVRVYPLVDWTPAKLRRWISHACVDGVLTIHAEVAKALEGRGVRLVFLNDQARHTGVPGLNLDPRHIGAEGVRLLHHSLLRREFGLPAEPKMVALQGSFKILKN